MIVDAFFEKEATAAVVMVCFIGLLSFSKEAAAVTLGGLVSISESTVYTPPMPMYDARGAAEQAASVPIAPGEVSMMTNVTVTYAIQ